MLIDNFVRCRAAGFSVQAHVISASGLLRLKQALILTLGVLACLALSACGGGGSSESSGPSVTPTAITTQPADQSVVAGRSATFNVVASGAALTYQWQTSNNGGSTWTDIPGAIGATFTSQVTVPELTGYRFRVIVKGSAGSVTSSSATLTVTTGASAPSITVQPVNQTASAGATASFSVTATGTALGYQWQSSADGTTWANISGATNPTLTLAAVAAADNGRRYRVVITNVAGTATSTAAVLTVSPAGIAPQISSQPTAVSVVAPQTATFTVVASGTPGPNYQWQVSTNNGGAFTDIVSATGASYTTPATVIGDNGKLFRVRVSNAAGTLTSSAAQLSVTAAYVAPQITTQPNSQQVTAPATATFRVVAQSSPAPTYQWQSAEPTWSGTNATLGEFANINGATASTYTTPPSKLSDSRFYRVIVSNGVDTVTSTIVNVAVVSPTDSLPAFPSAVSVDGSGNVFVGIDCGFAVTQPQFGLPIYCGIKKVATTGVLSDLAGGVTRSNVDGVGNAARFVAPSAMVIDGNGLLYATDDGAHTIRRITPAGAVTTLAGTPGVSGFVDGPGATARFNFPRGIAQAADGTLYVADYANCAVRKMTSVGVVSTLVGPSPTQACGAAVDGPLAVARIGAPWGIALDRSTGNLFVADRFNHTIRKITPAGIVSTLAGNAANNAGQGYVDGLGSSARFSLPSGLAIDASGALYVADVGNHAIRKVTPDGTVTTFAGGEQGYTDATGKAAKFSNIQGLAFDSAGNLHVAEYSIILGGLNYRAIRKISASGVVTTVRN